MTPRERWAEFRDFVERTPPLTDSALGNLLDEIDALPDAWLRRSMIVTLVRPQREVLSDAQLRLVAARYGGKFASFVETILRRRTARRAT